jgi:hypothetical protein
MLGAGLNVILRHFCRDSAPMNGECVAECHIARRDSRGILLCGAVLAHECCELCVCDRELFRFKANAKSLS